MALKLNEKQSGLTLGLLFAAMHTAWIIVVAAGPGQLVLNWLGAIHFISAGTTVGTFNAMLAGIGILFAFVCGTITGWVFAKIWNWLPKQKWYRQL